MAYFCYLVECCDGTYYAGWTTNPRRRELEHNRGGRGSRYTRLRRPVKMVYIEEQPDLSSAMRRERKLKALSHERKRALVERTCLNPPPSPAPASPPPDA